MKKAIVGLLAILPLLAFSTAVAQEREIPESSDEVHHGQTVPANPGRDAGDDTTLEQRVNKRKNALQIQLSEAERLHIQAHCQTTQAHLGRLHRRIVGVTVIQEQRYDGLLSKLAELVPGLQAAGIDTAAFEQQINELQTKMSAFYTALDEFEVAVHDLAAMDCAADPDGYKASLEEARTLRAKVLEASHAVRTHLQSVIKPALQTIRQQLASSQNNTGEEAHNHGE